VNDSADQVRTREIDYAQFPVTEEGWLDALVKEDDGSWERVPVFMRPYIRDGFFEPDGTPKRPEVLFCATPMSYARFQYAFDRQAPRPPWSRDSTPRPRVKRALWTAASETLSEAGCPTRIYFIGADDGPIKIGISASPKSRLTALQTASPFRLRLLAIRVGDVLTERDYHRRFAAHRLHGEWFERAPELLAEIERLNIPEGSSR